MTFQYQMSVTNFKICVINIFFEWSANFIFHKRPFKITWLDRYTIYCIRIIVGLFICESSKVYSKINMYLLNLKNYCCFVTCKETFKTSVVDVLLTNTWELVTEYWIPFFSACPLFMPSGISGNMISTTTMLNFRKYAFVVLHKTIFYLV